MATQPYRLTTTSRSASVGMVQETVVISAEDDDAAVELARTYVEAVRTEALSSAILTEASGALIWLERNWDLWDGEPDGSPRDGGAV